MFKNLAGQKIRVLALDSAGAPKTGDAANITAYIAKDRGTLTALTDTTATEISATNAPGVYEFDVSQTESNCDVFDITGKSATAGVSIVPQLNQHTVRAQLFATGTVGGTPSTTSIPTSALSIAGAAADQFKGRIIVFDANTATAALRGQATDITASTNAATPTFTVSALTTAPAVGDTFHII